MKTAVIYSRYSSSETQRIILFGIKEGFFDEDLLNYIIHYSTKRFVANNNIHHTVWTV